jgi:superfamily I DNA and RNA helicase
MRRQLSSRQKKAHNLEVEVRARTPLIEQTKFTIAKLKRGQHGQSSERSSVLDQLELELADLEEDVSEAAAQWQPSGPRRHHSAGSCQGKTGTRVAICARQPAVCRPRAAGRSVLLLVLA